MWFRVFGESDTMPQPAAIQQALRDFGHDVPLDAKGDELGWTRLDIPLVPPLCIERYLTQEDDLRDELNAWAALVETWTNGPEAIRLMQQIISTRQLFTWQVPDDAAIAFSEAIARHFASASAGIYQIDGRGFFAADGSLRVPEP